MSEHLFIGGPADGQRIEVPDHTENIDLPWRDDIPSVLQGAADEYADAGITFYRYRRVLLRESDGTAVSVFLRSSCDAVTVLRCLIHGYRKNH